MAGASARDARDTWQQKSVHSIEQGLGPALPIELFTVLEPGRSIRPRPREITFSRVVTAVGNISLFNEPDAEEGIDTCQSYSQASYDRLFDFTAVDEEEKVGIVYGRGVCRGGVRVPWSLGRGDHRHRRQVLASRAEMAAKTSARGLTFRAALRDKDRLPRCAIHEAATRHRAPRAASRAPRAARRRNPRRRPGLPPSFRTGRSLRPARPS